MAIFEIESLESNRICFVRKDSFYTDPYRTEIIHWLEEQFGPENVVRAQNESVWFATKRRVIFYGDEAGRLAMIFRMRWC